MNVPWSINVRDLAPDACFWPLVKDTETSVMTVEDGGSIL